MEYVILGFLMIRNLSQYDLLKAFSKDVSPFYKASLGSIQTRLQKLEINKSIICTNDEASNRKRKLYMITEKGIQDFYDWMMCKDISNNFEAFMINRIFFFGLVDLDTRISILKNFIEHLKNQSNNFKQEFELSNNASIPAGFEQVAKYQLKTLDLAIKHNRSSRIWCMELLNDLESERAKLNG